MLRVKPLVATLAVTGALVGGSAAIANAATSSAPATGSTGARGVTTTAPAHPTPAPGPNGTRVHHCPGAM